MKIHFDGADQTVTGSQHLLEIKGRLLLLDCGIFQGKREDFYKINANFPFDPHKLDAVILSHAHIDHSGNLPNLIKQGYAGPIYATPPTAELANFMLQDSGKIYEEDSSYINLKKLQPGQKPIEPLYTIADAQKVAEQFHSIPYDTPFEPIPGVSVRLVNAGHILGSAAIVLEINDNDTLKHLWFSGDIGRFKLPLLPDPVLPTNVDYVMMECTYGDTPHGDPEVAYQQFHDVVSRTIQRGGKIIVPAFAVGRTQEIVYMLNRMLSDGELPPLPVFVDSPLAINITDVFKKFPEYFDDETQQFMRTGHHPALTFPGLTYTRSTDESKAINNQKGPLIIISASGMCEAGRILHHLKNNVEDPKNTVAIVGWMAPNTLGRRIQEKQPVLRIFNEMHPLRAEVAVIGGLSAHAGQDGLLQYAQAAQKDGVKKIFLVHGEADAARAFEQLLTQNGITSFAFPNKGDVADI
jgi:metallo-beta-lactamase family protein